MDLVFFLVQKTMLFAIPLLVVGLGGMFSERSGIVNIALDGIMIFGAFCSVLFINFAQDYMQGQSLLFLAIAIAGISGILISLLHAYASINLNADQVISGTAINMLAPALAIYVARMIQGVQQISFNNTFRIREVPLLSDIPLIGPMFFKNAYLTTYLGFVILAVAAVVLYRTRFGLRLRACGEHPHAADSVGINVYKMRYAGVMISGFLAGLGGLIFVVPTSTEFNSTVSGYGFLALAVMIFGNWKPLPILGAALFFGFMKTIAAAYSGIPWLLELNLDSAFFKMTPFVATMIVLAFTSKRSQAPRAEGIPYDKGQR